MYVDLYKKFLEENNLFIEGRNELVCTMSLVLYVLRYTIARG